MVLVLFAQDGIFSDSDTRIFSPQSKFHMAPKAQKIEEDTLARQSDVTVATNATPHAEYKGFFVYVLASVIFFAYIGWTVVPEPWLQKIGVSYYPDKYWAHAVPAYLLIAMVYSYVFVALVNFEVKTLKLDDLRNFTDEHAVYPKNPEEYVWKAPSGVWDLPIGLVNDVLYGGD